MCSTLASVTAVLPTHPNLETQDGVCVQKLTSVTVSSHCDWFELVGCDTVRLLALPARPAVVAARTSEMPSFSYQSGVVDSTSLLDRRVICPAYVPAKGRCAVMFQTT